VEDGDGRAGQEAAFISVLEELAGLDERQVVPHCLEALRAAGHQHHLLYLQTCLLEAAHVKSGTSRSRSCTVIAALEDKKLKGTMKICALC